jgi:hypothetical protein
LPLKNRRGDYNWPNTKIIGAGLMADKKTYASSDSITIKLGFRIAGGLREAFQPDVWTVAWEDFDKMLRLTVRVSLKEQGQLRSKTLAEIKKEVRKASFYWSRDPDLPYRIWPMIVPEDGGPPQIPVNVEDAKSKMLDVEKVFKVAASSLGKGEHRLAADIACKWGRRSFIEKGEVTSKSKPLVITVE